MLWHTAQQGAEVTKQLVGRRGPELSVEGKLWEEEDVLRPRSFLPRLSVPGFIFVKLRIFIFDHHDGSNFTAGFQFTPVYFSSLFIFSLAAQQDRDPEGQIWLLH